ncbi:MAG: DUF4375 domain-containing protein [Candidatus Eremiobacteraeota bacterium]|nr:DUF4375 domain-containing protein [Candidatus Eremiobacteraeota bacterium]
MRLGVGYSVTPNLEEFLAQVEAHEMKFGKPTTTLLVLLLAAFAAAEPTPPSLEQKKWLEQYSGESTSTLLAMEDEYCSESIALYFEQALDQKSMTTTLTSQERTVLVIGALEREVNNGGFLLFFQNSSAEYALEAPDCLEEINCRQGAELARRALVILDVPASASPEEIQNAADEENEQRDERLDQLDQEYFSKVGDLSSALLTFIKNNQENIVLP